MKLRRRAYTLQCDVKCGDAQDKALRKAKVLPAHTTVIRESGSGKDNWDVLMVHDDDGMPFAAIDPAEKLFERVKPHLKRAPKSCNRILYEYNVYTPESVAAVLNAVLDSGLITLDQFEQVVKTFRSEYQSDLSDDEKVEAETDDEDSLDDMVAEADEDDEDGDS